MEREGCTGSGGLRGDAASNAYAALSCAALRCAALRCAELRCAASRCAHRLSSLLASRHMPHWLSA